MKTPSSRQKADRLFWLKYNPTEWLGLYPELSDEEYGLFHRIIAKLWATPGNRLRPEALLAELRVKPDSRRAEVIQALTGYALKVSEDGMLYVPAIDEAFSDAVKRGSAGTVAANTRWAKARSAGSPEDF